MPADGPNYGYGGGCYLADLSPIAVYRSAADDAPVIGNGIYTSRPIPGNGVEPSFHYIVLNFGSGPVNFKVYDNPGDALNYTQWQQGWRWRQEAVVYEPASLIPLQPGTGANFFYQHFQMQSLGECHMFRTSPSAYNNFHGALLVFTWDNQGKGGKPVVLRCADAESDRSLWVPSTADAAIQALNWQLDGTLHTVIPKINPTGFYNTAKGLGTGGQFSGPPIETSPGRLVIVMQGRLDTANLVGSPPIQGLPSSRIFESLDDGQTWTFISEAANGDNLGYGFQECNLCERIDAHGVKSLYLMHRHGDLSRSYQISTDGGFTWTAPVHVYFPGGASARPTLLEVGHGDGVTRTMFHTVRPFDFARMATMYASQDGGITWTGPVVFSPGTLTLVGAPPASGANFLGGQHTYTQLVEKQTRIPGVRPGIIGCFFSFSWGSGTYDSISNGSTMYYQEMILPA